jgi:hypothetical protein
MYRFRIEHVKQSLERLIVEGTVQYLFQVPDIG